MINKNNIWPDRPESLYIHWPFCSYRCDFCAHPSHKRNIELERNYHDALCKEIKRFGNDYQICGSKNKKDSSIKTIFLGGGTPSLYPLPLLKKLFEILKKSFNLKKLKQVTIESYPQDINEKLLKGWAELGINRLSVCIQILDDEILENLNRRQKKKEVLDLINKVPRYFDNISVDLILGLPGTTKKIWQDTLKTIVSWPINHISVYLINVPDKTPLFLKVKNNKINLLKDCEIISLYNETVKFLNENNFNQYEQGQFAKPGFESIYEKACWGLEQIKGFGLSAGSTDGFRWFENEKRLAKYLKSCKENNGKVKCVEKKLKYRQPKILGILKRNLEKKIMIRFYSQYDKTPLFLRLKNIIWQLKKQ